MSTNLGTFVALSPVLVTPEFAIPSGSAIVVEVTAVADMPSSVSDGNATFGALALAPVGFSSHNGVTKKVFRGVVKTRGAFSVEVDMSPSDPTIYVSASVWYVG